MDRINLGRIGGFHYCLLFRNNFIWLAVGRLSIASLSAFSILTMMMNTFALAFPYISPIMNMPAWICGQMVQAEQKLCWRVGLWVHSGVKGEKDDEYKRTNRTCGVVAICESSPAYGTTFKVQSKKWSLSSENDEWCARKTLGCWNEPRKNLPLATVIQEHCIIIGLTS